MPFEPHIPQKAKTSRLIALAPVPHTFTEGYEKWLAERDYTRGSQELCVQNLGFIVTAAFENMTLLAMMESPYKLPLWQLKRVHKFCEDAASNGCVPNGVRVWLDRISASFPR